MFSCQYCGYLSLYPVCPYDSTQINMNDRVCRNPAQRHSLEIPIQYRRYFQDWRAWTLAACPNCKTPYFYSDMPQELRDQFNKQRQSQGCFIATAAMGSNLHPYVQSLRAFRDDILLQSRHRQSFENLLNTYYKISPPIARLMIRHRFLKHVLRYTVVYPVVFGIKGILPVVDLVIGIRRDLEKKRNSESSV